MKEGEHDYNREKADRDATLPISSMLINIFQWQQKTRDRGIKKSKTIVTVYGDPKVKDKMIETADRIVHELNNNTYTGKKQVTVI